MDYKSKYLKYKNKYLYLRNLMIGGLGESKFHDMFNQTNFLGDTKVTQEARHKAT
jgi:hypothetical protein